MAFTEEDIRKEYNRLKAQIHTASVFEEGGVWSDIEKFGKTYNNKKLYKSLKTKFWWHRKILTKRFSSREIQSGLREEQEPLVSVIVPNYCHALYLKERIDSILDQTFQNFELILLDDCSTDNSRDILLSYKDHPKVSHIVLNETNTGNTFLQWEKGVGLAKGKYIWIAESDDYADETFLENVMNVFGMYTDSVLVRTGSYMVNEKGRLLLKDWDYWKEDESVHHYKGDTYIRHNMLHFNFIYNASMVVFRKDVFQRIDKSYQKLHYIGDWQCWIECLQQGAICEYRRKLNYFRQHEHKVSAYAKLSHQALMEQIEVMSYVLKNVRLSCLKKLFIRGELYDLVKRNLSTDTPQRTFFNETLRKLLGTRTSTYMLYKTIKIFTFLPFVPSMKNDKLK